MLGVVVVIALIGVRLSGLGLGAEVQTNINVGTYNIRSQRWDGLSAKYADWSTRKSLVENTIAKALPGIIGLQEVVKRNPDTLQYLSQRNDVIDFMTPLGYGYVVGAVDNSDPIFWRKVNFDKLTSGNVLIYDPSTSKLADKPAARYLTYARLRQTDHNKTVLVFNYHFNQYEQTGKQLDKLAETMKGIHGSYPNDDIFFAGDFNGFVNGVVSNLRERGISVRQSDGYVGTDHVFISPKVSVRSWVDTGVGSPPASDHPLIISRLTI
jgi:endonuclease/exonuclease/phosphatase family metal-dependent hydrolase